MRNSVASPDFDRAWDRILDRVAERASSDDLTQLIRPLRPLSLTPSQLRLEAPNRLSLVCITDKYLDGIPAGSRASRDGSLSRAQLTEQTLAKIRGLTEIAARRGQTLAQMSRARRSRLSRATITTRCSSTAGWASARRTW